MTHPRLTVSVIVCCYTEKRLTDAVEALASVRRQAPPPEEIVLVVDNNRALYERLREGMDQSVRVVLNQGVCGTSATRNAGVCAARGDLVAFLDDDAVAQEEWLVRLTGAFGDPDVVAAGGRAVLQWAASRPFWFPEELDWTVGGSLNWVPLERAVVRNPHGFSMCFRRKVFEAVGGFTTEIGNVREVPRGGEEADLCLRIVRRLPAAKVVWEPGAVVVHKVPASKSRFLVVLRRAYNEGLDKSWIRHKFAGNGNGPVLSPEKGYLKYLLSRALPSRLVRVWHFQSMSQAAAIVFSVIATALGYAIGVIRSIRPLRSAR